MKEGLLTALQKKACKGFSFDSQQEAWELFKKKGLLHEGDYLLLQKLYQKSWEENPIASESPRWEIKKGPRLVFIDGRFRRELSSLEDLEDRLIACPLQEALKTYSSLLKGRFSRFLQEEQEGFVWLNHALCEEGFFLYFPKNFRLQEPIEIVELYSAERMTFPKTYIYLGSGAEVTLSFQAKALEGGFVSHGIEFHLEERSRCRVYQDLLDTLSSFYMDHIAAFLKKEASFSYLAVDKGAELLRQSFHIQLVEPRAEATLKGLSLLERHKQSHQKVLMEHKAQNTTSWQHFKGAVFEKARLSFEGKIWVDPAAQGTQAYQKSNHLLLEDKAEAFSKPNLEIFTDDVKASHGATLAQLQDEELFYFRARGLNPALAKKLLLRGFCKEVVDGYLEERVDCHLKKMLD